MSLIAIATFIAMAFTQASVAPFDSLLEPGYTMVATQGTYGIIIDGEYAARTLGAFDDERHETWTPTREDVARAEDLIQELRPDDAIDAEQRARAESPEDLVSRTWYGEIVDDQRILHVDGYCTGGMPEQPLEPFIVMDGGACFWGASIDADTWEIIGYRENGEA